jgi:DNA-binding GntR family transcriptional regulator
VHGEIRSLLLTGELAYTEYLAEERLARSLGCSRTPVREAFARLESEGFLERDTAGHFRPRPPQMDRMRDLYVVRASLERLSVQLASDLDALRLLRDDWAALEPAERDDAFVYLDEAYHLGIADATGNRALVEMLRQVNDQIRVVRVHDFVVPGRIVTTIRQHLEILDAVLAGRGEEGARLMEAHVVESAAQVEAAIARLWAQPRRLAPAARSER